MKNKHTPTPWSYDPDAARYIEGPDGIIIAETYVLDTGMLRANTAHIVRCVNSHDELLAALKELIASRDSNAFSVERFVPEDESIMKGSGGYYSPHASMVNSDVIAKARALIEKIEAQ